MITAGYNVPTLTLYQRIKRLDDYLESVIKRGGYQEGGKKGLVVGKRLDEWPGICVGLFHDAVANMVGYSAAYATNVTAFYAWVNTIDLQTGLPPTDTMEEEIEELLTNACDVIVRMGNPSARSSLITPIDMTWMHQPANVALASQSLLLAKPFNCTPSIVPPVTPIGQSGGTTSGIHFLTQFSDEDDDVLLYRRCHRLHRLNILQYNRDNQEVTT